MPRELSQKQVEWRTRKGHEVQSMLGYVKNYCKEGDVFVDPNWREQGWLRVYSHVKMKDEEKSPAGLSVVYRVFYRWIRDGRLTGPSHASLESFCRSLGYPLPPERAELPEGITP